LNDDIPQEEHTTQWPKKVQKDKQRSTKHKAKDQTTQTPLKNNKSNRNTTNFIDV
jgi:hypothetical protein